MVGAPFEGRYTLTGVRHTFDARGYRTLFSVSGRDRSLRGLVKPGPSPAFLGVLAGVVSDVDDPERPRSGARPSPVPVGSL